LVLEINISIVNIVCNMMRAWQHSAALAISRRLRLTAFFALAFANELD